MSFPFGEILKDFDEILQAKDIAVVWPIVGGVAAFGAFESGVGKVYHPDVNSGVVAAGSRGAVWCGEARVVIQGRCVLLGLLAVVNDEKGAGVEPVRALLPDDGEQSLQPQDDGLQQVRSEAVPVAQELAQGLSESLRRELPAVVLIFAEKVASVCLVNLEGREKTPCVQLSGLPKALDFTLT